MTCDRCKDIHEAQREGKTQNKCWCDCHGCTCTWICPWTYTYTYPSTTTTGTFTLNGNTAACNSSTWVPCNCITSSHQCDKCSGKSS